MRKEYRLQNNWVHLRYVKYEQHALFHADIESIVFLMEDHCFWRHIWTFDMNLVLIISDHTRNVEFSVLSNRVHKLSELIHDNTFYLVAGVNIKGWVSVHVNFQPFNFNLAVSRNLFLSVSLIITFFSRTQSLKFSDLLYLLGWLSFDHWLCTNLWQPWIRLTKVLSEYISFISLNDIFIVHNFLVSILIIIKALLFLHGYVITHDFTFTISKT